MKSNSDNIRLSKYVQPVEYFLSIKPDLSAFTFTGEEEIIIDVKKPTKELELHSDELSIKQVIYNESLIGKVTYSKERETARIIFEKQIPIGQGKLYLKFEGFLNDKMRGFYRSKYEIAGKEHHMAVTQFESTDARRAFPCFDEPSQKAIFNVKLIIPSELTAISNTFIQDVKEHSGGCKILSFAPTPLMSTYLLAFIVGKFEHIEKKADDGTMVRIFVTPGKKKQAEFALDVAAKTVAFFAEYFRIPFPISVLDLVAIPDFAAGAMENWGAVTYRETALLVDEENTATANKQWVALVIAHELAHQWFGDLVTMEWWTHLWLNEGFATYIEYLAVDHIFPEWEIWTQFVYMDHGRALELDGLRNSHPIEVEVHNPSEISEIFDAVSYSKGASVIRMIAEYLGHDIFRKGLQMYLKKHSYSNATTDDLWDALENISHKPVKKIMENWTKQAGYPLVTLIEKNDGILLFQSRFLSSVISQQDSLDHPVWHIPLSILYESTKEPEYHLLTKRTQKISRSVGKQWIKLNIGEVSLIRIQYTQKSLEKLKPAIQNKALSTSDRFGIIRDAFVMSEAGNISTDHVLSMYPSYVEEDSYVVWAEIASSFAKLSNLLADDPDYIHFEKYALEIFKLIGKRLGWEKTTGEDHSRTLLRQVVLSSLGKYGDEKIITKSQNVFKGMIDNNIKIDSDLRGIIYANVARYGNENTYNQLLNLYRSVAMQEEKDRILKALCLFKQKDLLQETLTFAFTSEVRAQDSFKSINFVLANPQGRYIAWDFLKTHWEEIVRKFSGGHIFSRFVEPIEYCTKKSDAVAVENFFNSHKAPGAERTIQQVLEKIYSNDAWMERDLEKIKKFLHK